MPLLSMNSIGAVVEKGVLVKIEVDDGVTMPGLAQAVKKINKSKRDPFILDTLKP